MSSEWWVNGRRARHLPVDDRGLAYADGLFETIAVERGLPRLLAPHLERLAQGCRRLGLPAPDPDRLRAELRRISARARRAATLKLIVTRGSGPRGYTPPEHPRPLRLVGLLARTPAPEAHYSQGIAAGFSRIALPVSPATAGLKTLARTEQVLAAAERRARGWDEALMCDADGWLICGTMSNVFIVRENRLLTPRLDRAGVAGVMRRLVIAEARLAGLQLSETRVRPDDALRAGSELFVSNALLGIRPVARLGRRRWQPGPVTRLLMQRLVNQGISECSAGC